MYVILDEAAWGATAITEIQISIKYCHENDDS